MASRGDHLVHSVPFISDTGNYPPEASIFTILFSLGALLVAIIVLIRQKIFEIMCQSQNGSTKCCFSSSTKDRIKQLSQCSLISGLLTVVGLIVIGNFRSSEMNSMHNLGTYITCIFGTLDIILQSQIAFKTGSKKIAIIRLIIVSIIIPSFLGYIFIEFVNKKFLEQCLCERLVGPIGGRHLRVDRLLHVRPFYATFIPAFRQLKSVQIVLNYSDADRNELITSESECQSLSNCDKQLND